MATNGETRETRSSFTDVSGLSDGRCMSSWFVRHERLLEIVSARHRVDSVSCASEMPTCERVCGAAAGHQSHAVAARLRQVCASKIVSSFVHVAATDRGLTGTLSIEGSSCGCFDVSLIERAAGGIGRRPPCSEEQHALLLLFGGTRRAERLDVNAALGLRVIHSVRARVSDCD